MLNRQASSVFIIGAGASCEFDLPAGDKLKQSIASKLNFSMDDFGKYHGGDNEIRLALTLRSNEDPTFNNWIDSTLLISQAMPLAPSIDNFLNIHSDNEVVKFAGKSAIVKCIIEAEKSSRLYYDPFTSRAKQIRFRNSENTWLNSFFKSVTTNCSLGELCIRFKKISFIVFNYDRCIEHFLLHAIMLYYNIDIDTSASVLSNLDIYHPYGTVGKLRNHAVTAPTPFGASLQPNEIIRLANNITTFTEGSNKSDTELFEMRKTLAEASQIVFLGFAFHDINMELLCAHKSSKIIETNPRIFATAFGQSSSDTEEIAKMLSKRFRCQKSAIIIRNDIKCNELLNEYSRAIDIKGSPANMTVQYA